MSAADRAARGAVLLDEKRRGWAGRIDLGALEMNNCAACVIGQLWDDRDDDPGDAWRRYDAGLAALGIADPDDDPDMVNDEASFGFTAEGMAGKPGEWAALNAAWIAEIRRRTETTT